MADESSASVMRAWTGWIATSDREEYRVYVTRTGLSEYRATAGNLGAWMAYRDLDGDRTEVLTVSLWSNRAAIVAFAGDDIDVARFYPDDDRFLLDRETFVRHYDLAE